MKEDSVWLRVIVTVVVVRGGGEGHVTSGELSVCVCVCDRSRAALPTVLLATNMAAAATL